jgi:hypothetical protein
MMAELLSMGFDAPAVARAIERHRSVRSAVDALLRSSSGGSCSTDPAPAAPAVAVWSGSAAGGLLQLPPELLSRVLGHASFQQLATLRQTSRGLDGAAGEEAVQRARQRLGEALGTGFRSDGLAVAPAKVVEVATSLEAALCIHRRACSVAGARKFRQILFNVKDAKNPEIRGGLLSGALDPQALLHMSGRDMASAARKEQRSEWRQRQKQKCIRQDWRDAMPKSDLHRCESCGGNETRVHRVRAAGRMAVDRVRTYATCVHCNARWET